MAVDEDRGGAVSAAQRWLGDGLTRFGDPFFDLAARGGPPDLHIETRLAGREPDAVSVMLNLPTYDGDYLYAAYSPVLFDALLESMSDVPIGGNVVFTANGVDGESHTGPTLLLDVDRIDSETSGSSWLRLRLLTIRTAFTRPDGMEPVLTFLRDMAHLSNPVHGEIFWGNHYGGVLEEALNLRPELTLPTARALLRGYTWLTILPEEIGRRLGGLDALRSSGAFVDVEHLDTGGYWCQATRNLDDYDQRAADQIFDVVAPTLPPGVPCLRDSHSLPNFLATRDASKR
ncbi:hypothetical protein [Dactylosporangium matsuzakiense]|uniref:hypothetical protein n=1 Tax=Dactylosporangium matsuzakiense TaxID=53360 RepID=UPI0022F3272C|nr:hypothetical protein [Dactylosporangium matsuzakiense]